MLHSEEFAKILKGAGYDFFAGVPCSLISDVILFLEKDPDVSYIPAVREDVAVGLAAGAYLGGKIPCVLMQNSGLGQCLNALTSLNLIYRIPCLLIVTWRGYKGHDAPEHEVMGRASTKLLNSVNLPYKRLTHSNAEKAVRWSHRVISKEKVPVVLFIPKGVLK
ncbi:MAG: thiamine pyrophosphate-binding protein [Candidatus Brocadiales bacterium]